VANGTPRIAPSMTGWKRLVQPKDPEDQKVGDLDTAHARRLRCNRQGGDYNYRCTREAGHTGQHIVGDTDWVIDTWPQEEREV
jgi:hypothetical protein